MPGQQLAHLSKRDPRVHQHEIIYANSLIYSLYSTIIVSVRTPLTYLHTLAKQKLSLEHVLL